MPRLFFNNRPLGDIHENIHLWGRWIVYALIALHLGGIVFHVSWRRDRLLERMLPRPREPADTDVVLNLGSPSE
jgi:cytochrome b561